ncbi:MAG: hypothetical protein FJ253_04850, partial [Phycisphaerae bacterium]|nr:hypothetical protein [Phycisphaerae bacterium]
MRDATSVTTRRRGAAIFAAAAVLAIAWRGAGAPPASTPPAPADVGSGAPPANGQNAPASNGQGAAPDQGQGAAAPPVVASPLPSLDELRRQIDALKAIEKPGDEEKRRLERLSSIAERVTQIEVNLAKAAEWRDAVAQKSTRLEALRAGHKPVEAPPEGASIEQLDAALTLAGTVLASAREALTGLENQGAQLVERRRALPEEIARARSELSEARRRMQSSPANDGGGELGSLANLARVEELASLLSLREAELASLDARSEFVAVERTAQEKRIADAEALGRSLRAELDERRSAQAHAAAEQSARAHRDGTGSLVAQTTARNAELAQRLQDAGRMLNRISEETTLREEELKRIEREYTADQDRSKVASSSGKLSQLLRRQRQSLPSPRTLEASIAARRAMRGEIDL